MSRYFLRDMAERALSTYLQVVIPAITAAVITDWSLLAPVLLSGIPAALSVLKSVLANKYAPGTISPASLATTPSPFRSFLSADSFHDEA